MEMRDVNIKVFIKDKGNLIANSNVSINTVLFAFVTIKGFQIWRSDCFNERLQEKINITPPTRPAYGRYIPQVFFEDKNKWFELEQMIYNAFNTERLKKSLKQKTEDVNIDDIPDDLGQ